MKNTFQGGQSAFINVPSLSSSGPELYVCKEFYCSLVCASPRAAKSLMSDYDFTQFKICDVSDSEQIILSVWKATFHA